MRRLKYLSAVVGHAAVVGGLAWIFYTTTSPAIAFSLICALLAAKLKILDKWVDDAFSSYARKRIKAIIPSPEYEPQENPRKENQMKLDHLRDCLDRAVALEEYEIAAEIRNQIEVFKKAIKH